MIQIKIDVGVHFCPTLSAAVNIEVLFAGSQA
jgi:hypothetical protein